MRPFAVTMMMLAACGGTAAGDFDLAVEASCMDCTADATHRLDLFLTHLGSSGQAGVECSLAGGPNIELGERGATSFAPTADAFVRVEAGTVANLLYDFRCTGDGVIEVTCDHRGESYRSEEVPITCLTEPPAGPAVAVLDVTGTQSAFAMFIYSAATAFSQSITAEAAQITGLPIGDCVSYVRNFANVPLESAGSVVIQNNGATVATLTKSPSTERREFGPFTITVGTAYDIVIGGAGAITATTASDVLRPAPAAVFPNLTFVADTISSPTFAYQPVAADFLFLIFAYISASGPVELWCRLDPAGTSYTMKPADYDGLGISGTVRAETQNRGRFTLGGVNQDVMVNAHSSAGTGQFTKQ
jgi:hypothetical protein